MIRWTVDAPTAAVVIDLVGVEEAVAGVLILFERVGGVILLLLLSLAARSVVLLLVVATVLLLPLLLPGCLCGSATFLSLRGVALLALGVERVSFFVVGGGVDGDGSACWMVAVAELILLLLLFMGARVWQMSRISLDSSRRQALVCYQILMQSCGRMMAVRY